MKRDYEINEMNEINEKYRVFVYFVYFVISLHSHVVRWVKGLPNGIVKNNFRVESGSTHIECQGKYAIALNPITIKQSLTDR